MRRSIITWQAVMKFHGGIIGRAFPHGTAFRSSYNSRLSRARIIVNSGLCEFVTEFAQHYFNNLSLKEYTKPSQLPLKLAYVVPNVNTCGGIAVILEHANRLIKRGYDVILISMQETSIKADWFPNNLVSIYPLSNAPENIDILVATEWGTTYIVDKMMADKKFYFIQSDESKFYEDENRDLKERALNTYNFNFEFITMAKWIQKWLKENFNRESVYVPNALNPETIFPSQPLEPKNPNKIRILLEGPIDFKFKGMADAFKVIEDLDCEVWCVSYFGRPKAHWKCDKFFEKVPMDQMKYIYSSCDILLKMSRVESFGYPPLEMMACGGCVVVGETSGYAEYIIDGYNAFVVKQGDINGARSAIKRLINDANLREIMIKNGLETAKKWNNWEKSIDLLEKIYFPQLEDPDLIP